jgi:hypothetical protein
MIGGKASSKAAKFDCIYGTAKEQEFNMEAIAKLYVVGKKPMNRFRGILSVV